MLRAVVLFFACIISFYGRSQECCKLSAGQEFAMLANDEEFSSSHGFNENLPLVKSGTNIKFKVADQEPGNAYLILASGISDKYLFVFHEWWGLNDHIKAIAEKYHKRFKGEVNVIAIDLYDGKSATDPVVAGDIMKSRDEKRLKALVNGALAYAGKDASIATVGWCFGGGWSLQAAIQGGNAVKSCVMYYGMPETTPSKIAKIKAPVLGIFAEKDTWINHDLVDTFEDRMRGLEKKITVKWYDAVHAFANPSNKEYAPVLAADAFVRSAYFIEQNW